MREKGVGQKRNSPPQPTRNADMLFWDISSLLCYSANAHVAFAAFSSLFCLVRDYQLDYPDLYPRLYVLLDVWTVEAEPEFGTLLDACFKSSHLPLQVSDCVYQLV
jgi:hypothetical protein